MKRLLPILCWIVCALNAYAQPGFVKENLVFAQQQLKALLVEADRVDSLFPRTITREGKLKLTDKYDWTPGFFPGSLWYAYEQTGDESLKTAAIRWTEKLEPLKKFTGHHDLGFMVYCSYGNAYKITNNPAYKEVLIEAARSLCTRFNKVTGSIKSWNSFKGFDGGATYHFPVIIDNMMNLELLFFAAKATGDASFRDIAITHADNTLKNHLRKDYSSYHVVCYDTVTGKPISKQTAQGYANNSAWSRGQSWGLYGFTLMYRETKQKRYLDAATRMADFLVNHPNLPADKVPYWDYNANTAGFTPGPNSKALRIPILYRDASAGAIMASALLELSQYVPGKKAKYIATAETILRSLAGPAYRAEPGTNGHFILQHSVGSLPGASEVDVPLVYADYYFLEGLSRLQRVKEGKELF